ncbi:pantoate--beta-alanine ligase [Aureivirga sp. CE67]|uniref:pantoate--beta-alanine ligase n=1 Tax=Aureivirga sp. CE67 TaxID=1788983 RepID=UPI0018C9FF72|nr:pantoate--beta-alanine ligase [Aureivirga sp. CE67]
MLVFKTKSELIEYLKPSIPQENIGFVPTMGALHKGHISLVEKAKKENEIVVVSIFVNPTQFNNSSDLVNYPKTLDNDLKMLEEANCDCVFVPSVEEMYEQNINSETFEFDGLENEMEGKFRPGHFDGVGTIVRRLFEIVNPTNAYFGEKDFQQLQIIKKMVAKTSLEVNVIGCSIFREKDGLAMSSRNMRLTEAQRKASPFIYETLQKAKKLFSEEKRNDICEWVENQFKTQSELELEYFIIAEEESLKEIKTGSDSVKPRAFIAVFAGEIRLIDNISLI